ncbi:porin family protein [Bacteroides sp. 224]|uniref:porin family protein n=1 Tax=Bacteroides sp. 224 TaxID=2302936 RepID=UPI0013D42D17|nr:porin family protein [Bacteroides sp. 224]NDV64538.1 PorT family protein [Bacteroides sp. 224]
MKRLVILYILSSFTLLLWSQGKSETVSLQKKPSLNFGMKVGFNSSMYTVSELKIKDVTIDDTQNNYKIGYFASIFMRLNIEDHYIQPEIAYQYSKCQVTFDKLGAQHHELEPDYASISSKLHSIELPVLYGYSIINRNPYGLSVFIGPKFKYLWNKKNKIEFENFDQELEEELRPLNISITAGLAVNISKIFFDFRYEHGLNNISKGISYVHYNQEISEKTASNMTFKRRENVLSFSFGMMF